MTTTEKSPRREAAPGAQPAARPARRKARWWHDGFRPLLLRLHFFVGVFVGPFILVAAVTGLLYTLTPAIEQVVYRDTLTVAPAGDALPLAEQVGIAQRAVPDGTLTEVRPATEADDVTRVVFASDAAPAGRSITAFVNPYGGTVTNVLPTYGEWLPVRSWFDEMHRTLLLGDVGRLYSELAASWLWVLAVSGIGIWVFRRVRKGRRRSLVVPAAGARGRGRLMGWHGALGVWLAVGMLFLAATGLTWSQFAGANVGSLRAALNWSTPSAAAALPAGTEVPAIPAEDVPAAVERVAASARAEGLDGPVAITPAEGGSAWTASQAQRSWPEKQDSISVDPATGEVLSRVDFADWPLAAKLARWGVDAHMGVLFGTANQIALGLLAIGIICMILWGYRMWWLRRPTRANGGTARFAAPLGEGRAPSRVAVITVALVGIGVGLFAPVLGGSLILFIAFDVVAGFVAERRATRAHSRRTRAPHTRSMSSSR